MVNVNSEKSVQNPSGIEICIDTHRYELLNRFCSPFGLMFNNNNSKKISTFARKKFVEKKVRSIFNHPIFNVCCMALKI
jgi:hypothetical protein